MSAFLLEDSDEIEDAISGDAEIPDGLDLRDPPAEDE